jgi:O-antigen/teichoic acid export membrane protein
MHRRIFILMTGAMGGQALAFIALPLIARLYTPDQLGAFQIMLAFCNTLGAVSALSLERTQLLDIGPRRKAYLGGLSLATVLTASLISVPGYLLFTLITPGAPLFVAGVPVLFFVLSMTLFRGLFLIEYTTAIATERDRTATFSVFVKDIVRIALRIGLGLTALNPVGLFVAGVADWFVGTVLLYRKGKMRWPSQLKRRALLRRFRDYPLFYAPATALTSLTGQMPVLLLGSFYSVREAGLYSLAFLLLDRPSRILAKASGDVLMQGMARSSEGKSRNAVVQKAIVLSALNLPILLLIAFITYLMADTLLGSDWTGAGWLALACVPHALALFVSELSIGLFAAVARTASGLLVNGGAILGHGSDGIVLSRAA